MRFIREVEIFVTVAEAGSFTAAARRLQTAKSSVSDAIRALEDRLGVRLLDRTTRTLRLTDGGQAFFARCRGMLDDLDRAQDEAQASQAAAAGQLRIAVPEAFSQTFIVPCLRRLIGDDCTMKIELASDSRSVHLVTEDFDFAIRIAIAIPASLIARRLGTQRMVVVASPDYLGNHGVPVSPADLDRHQVIGTIWPLPGHDGLFLNQAKVPITPQVTMNSAVALKTAAIDGLGLVAVPDWLVQDALSTGALRRVLHGFDAAERGIYVVHSLHRLLSPAAGMFIRNLELEMHNRGVPID